MPSPPEVRPSSGAAQNRLVQCVLLWVVLAAPHSPHASQPDNVAEFRSAIRRLTHTFEYVLAWAIDVRFSADQCTVLVTRGLLSRLSPSLPSNESRDHFSFDMSPSVTRSGVAFIRQITAEIHHDELPDRGMAAIRFTLDFVSPYGHEIPQTTTFALPRRTLPRDHGRAGNATSVRWYCQLVEGTRSDAPAYPAGAYAESDESDSDSQPANRPGGMSQYEATGDPLPEPSAPAGAPTATTHVQAHADHMSQQPTPQPARNSEPDGADPAYGPQQDPTWFPTPTRGQKIQLCKETADGVVCSEASDEGLMNEAMHYRY